MIVGCRGMGWDVAQGQEVSSSSLNTEIKKITYESQYGQKKRKKIFTYQKQKTKPNKFLKLKKKKKSFDPYSLAC